MPKTITEKPLQPVGILTVRERTADNMAIENKVTLYGQIVGIQATEAPENKDGIEYTDISLMVRTIRRKNAGFGIIKGRNMVDTVPVIFRNQDLIRKLNSEDMDIGIGYMIHVYGVLCTIPVRRRWSCPDCGEKNVIAGTSTFVHPLQFKITETPSSIGLKDGEEISFSLGLAYMKEMDEESNRIKIMGSLCRDPEYYETPGGIAICTYQLATDRAVHLLEDGPQIRTDYPWVRSLGKVAESDRRHLRKGSLVYIDGSILHREGYMRTGRCEFCGHEVHWADRDGTMDIIPYEVEYLRNYDDPEGGDEAADQRGEET